MTDSSSLIGWRRQKVVDLCATHVDCVNRTAPLVEGPTPYKMIRTTNVRNGFIDTESVRFVTEETYRRWTRRLVPLRGDVVLTREAPLGDVGIVRSDDHLFLGQRLYHLRADPQRLDSRFLAYALMAPDLQAQIRSYGSGSTVEHMRLEDIPLLEFDVPPLFVQRKLAGVLAAYDDLIEHNLRRIQILEDMARAIYREWFVHFRFPGHQSAARVKDHLGAIPEGWEVKPLAELAAVNRAQVNARSAPSEVHYIDISAVSPSRIESTTTYPFADAPGRARRIVQHGDVLWSCVRPNRRSHALVMHPRPATIASTGFAVMTAQGVPYTFLYQATTTDDFVAYLTNHATGAAYPAVTASAFEQAKLLIPSKPLLEKFGELTTPMAEHVAMLYRQVVSLRATSDLLLPRLMSGQLTLPEAEEAIPVSL